MALILQQVRRCDGKCCQEKPRWPNAEGTDCIYRISPDGKETSGCKLMTGAEPVPSSESPAWPGRNSNEVFQQTCVDWPQNMSSRNMGNCCWQWVDDGN